MFIEVIGSDLFIGNLTIVNYLDFFRSFAACTGIMIGAGSAVRYAIDRLV
jgi:hypothetical protein